LPNPNKKKEIISEEAQKELLALLNGYYDDAVEYFLSEHLSLREREKENRSIMQTRGEMTEEQTLEYAKLRKSYEQLFKDISTLAQFLGRDLPELPEEEENTTRITYDTTSVNGWQKTTAEEKEEPIWGDEDTRSFYEDLLDLKTKVPISFLGETKDKGKKEGQPEEKDEGQQEIAEKN